jgi:hypothetical protein
MPTLRSSAPAGWRVHDGALADAGLNVMQLAVLRRVARFEGEPRSHIATDLETDLRSVRT